MLIERIDQDPKRTCSFSIRQSVSDRVDLYRELYEEKYGTSIDRSELVDRLLSLVLDKDKEFRKFEREHRAAHAKKGRQRQADEAGASYDANGTGKEGPGAPSAPSAEHTEGAEDGQDDEGRA